jgi:isopenicillin N synthase-like dioxygenase
VTAIPEIDLAGDPARVAAVLFDAYAEVGFAYLVGHGVEPGPVDAIFDASRWFHALALDQKLRWAIDANHRGYIAIDTSTDRTSTLAEVTKPNQSESFMIMRDDTPDSPDVLAGSYLAGPNQWPEVSGFKAAAERYQAALSTVAGRLTQVIAAALGDDRGVIRDAFATPTTWLRLLHYPPQPPLAPGDLYGSAPHCDFGFITLLAQDEVGGLQVQSPAGEWIDVPPRPEAFVMNVGDMLHRWSNGRLRSTPHRVINRSGRRRYSVAFFYDPRMTTRIEPLPSCVDAEHPARFEPIVFADFLRHQLTTTYDRHAAPPSTPDSALHET